MNQRKIVIPVIIGPTASGKTDIAVNIAPKINAEIISADSRQVYKQLDVGTAKPTPLQRQKARFHLIDHVALDADYSAGQFAEDAMEVIEEIRARKKRPLVVGGSGLYIRALFSPMFSSPKPAPGKREELDRLEQEKGLGCLFAKLAAIDPVWAEKVGAKDRQRIKRGLEVFQATGRRISEWVKDRPVVPYAPYYIGIEVERAVLYRRIDDRFLKMIDDGLIGEVKRLLDQGCPRNANALNTVGYKEMIGYLDGILGLDEAIKLAQKNTRNYAKRQLTWFRGLKNVHWLPPDEKEILRLIHSLLSGQQG